MKKLQRVKDSIRRRLAEDDARPPMTTEDAKRLTKRLAPWVFLAVVFLLLLPGAVATVWVPACSSCHVTVAEATAERAHVDMACTDCHNTGGRLAYRQIVMYSMVTRLANPSNLGAANVSDETCLTCHETDVTRGTTLSNGINIRHSACAATLACTVCHSTAGHSTPGLQYQYSMDQCLWCHTDQMVDAANEESCYLCHDGRYRSVIPNNTSAFRITHNENWLRTHGLGDMNSCRSCHTTETFCGRCHGPLVPHPPTILMRHSEPARDPNNKCDSCHPQSFCDDCHGMEIPHPERFLQEHAAITNELGEDACYGCHLTSDCLRCHMAHIHPGWGVFTR
ncbi:MAG: hypothetical protein FWG78_00775 [Coriobacteriia bacterium]|nr:hypothetical protein [Coriobacteriia bacterium]